MHKRTVPLLLISTLTTHILCMDGPAPIVQHERPKKIGSPIASISEQLYYAPDLTPDKIAEQGFIIKT